MTTKTRNKTKAVSEESLPVVKRVENSWILLVKDSLFENDSFDLITLPHPADRRPSKFCLDDANNQMYEVVAFSEPHRSWFVGETVKSDGSLLMLTPVNPLFLVLPRLREQCVNRAMPLEGLLSEKGFDKMTDFVKNLELIGDLKGSPDLKAFKYNEEKTLIWLKEKVEKLAKVLRKKNIHVTSGAISATFVASNINNDNVDDEFYLKYAHGLISEYLQDDLSELLEKKFDFKPELIEAIGNKRKSEVTDNETNKKIKYDDDPEINYNTASNFNNENKKQKPLSLKEKARQKAASGTKTISSFFFKK